MTVIVDTNVILVADQQHEGVSPDCISACAQRLLAISASGRIALDDDFRILSEYQNKRPAGSAKGPGGAFLKWALQNRSNAERCDLVTIHEHSERGFAEFPADKKLCTFDASDRMFVAVSAAHPDNPPILQGTDSKWLDWASHLVPHGVTVEFLCPADTEAFRKRKAG